MHDVFMWLALGLYGLGILLLIPSVVHRRPSLSPAALGALGLGLLAHAGAIAVVAARIHRLPVTDVAAPFPFTPSWLRSPFFSLICAIASLPSASSCCRWFFF